MLAVLAGLLTDIVSANRLGVPLVCDITRQPALCLANGAYNCTTAISQAFSSCRDGGTVLFPGTGRYLSGPLIFQDLSNVTVHLVADWLAYPALDDWPAQIRDNGGAFIQFEGAAGLQIVGPGAIDGQGSAWWALRRTKPSAAAPTLIYIYQSINVSVSNLTLRDSPKFNLKFDSSRAIEVSYVHISAPNCSPNTDGYVLPTPCSVFLLLFSVLSL